jgi:hypothetical protein
VLVVTDYDDGNLKEGVKTTTEGKYSALITWMNMLTTTTTRDGSKSDKVGDDDDDKDKGRW